MTTTTKVYSGTFESIADALNAVINLIEDEINNTVNKMQEESKKEEKNISVNGKTPECGKHICVKPTKKPVKKSITVKTKKCVCDEDLFKVSDHVCNCGKKCSCHKKSSTDDVDFVDHFNG